MPFKQLCFVLILLVPILICAKGAAKGDSQDEGENAPFNVGLFPYADMNAYRSDPVNNFSFDILAGYVYGIKGVELSGGVSIVRQDLTGFQYSGLANVTLGEAKGVQMSTFNVAMKLKGLQIGLINYADEATENAATLGLLSFVRKGGRHSLDVWTSDVAIFNVGTKIGAKRLYTVLGFGLQPKVHPDYATDEIRWGPQFGLGGNIPLPDAWSLGLEAVYFIAFNDEPKFEIERATTTAPVIIISLKLLANYQFNNSIGVFAGPAIHIAMVRPLSAISYLPDGATFHLIETFPGSLGIGFVAGAQLF